MMAVPLPRDVEKLLNQYLDPLSSSHLLSTQDRLLRNIQRDSELYPMSVDTIQNFKKRLEWESKMREYKLLVGAQKMEIIIHAHLVGLYSIWKDSCFLQEEKVRSLLNPV